MDFGIANSKILVRFTHQKNQISTKRRIAGSSECTKRQSAQRIQTPSLGSVISLFLIGFTQTNAQANNSDITHIQSKDGDYYYFLTAKSQENNPDQNDCQCNYDITHTKETP